MESDIDSKKKDIVSFFLKKGVLVTEDLIETLNNEENLEEIYELISKSKGEESDLLVLNNDLKNILCKGNANDVLCKEFEKSMVLAQKHKKTETYNNFIKILGKEESKSEQTENQEEEPKTEEKKYSERFEKVKVITNFTETEKKKEIQDFVRYFNKRFNTIEKLLRQRGELQNILSIGRVLAKKDRETVSIIGIISDKHTTKNGNFIFTVEDNTGTIKVLVNKNNPQLFEQAQDIVLDEIIGIVGVNAENIIFSNQIIWPDIPNNQLKKTEDESYAVFLSDLHVGSDTFLSNELNKFITWISGESGNEMQKSIAQKVEYIFIIGDLVDGVGIYPGQEKELIIQDISEQYAECAKILDKIPKRIKVIICPGNHDAMRIAEPQLEIYKDFSKPLWDIENVMMVTNPAMVNIHASEGFSGFDVLLYHGYSFDYFIANVDSIRNGGGYDRADLVMKFLLKRRHLAPSHKSTLYIPNPDEDYLVIKKVPDFFATGHIHKTSVANYKGTTMICGSCWQATTAFQVKVGHHPEPCRVPIVNLKTRDVKILKFN